MSEAILLLLVALLKLALFVAVATAVGWFVYRKLKGGG
jgi:hypothetical protein